VKTTKKTIFKKEVQNQPSTLHPPLSSRQEKNEKRKNVFVWNSFRTHFELIWKIEMEISFGLN